MVTLAGDVVTYLEHPKEKIFFLSTEIIKEVRKIINGKTLQNSVTFIFTNNNQTKDITDPIYNSSKKDTQKLT